MCATISSCGSKGGSDDSSAQEEATSSPIQQLFSSEEALKSDLEGKFLNSDNQAVIYFKKNQKFEVNAYVDDKIEEVARGKYNITTDNETPCVELRGNDSNIIGKVTAKTLNINIDGANYTYGNLKIITREEAEKWLK